jgi:hypothetical protein
MSREDVVIASPATTPDIGRVSFGTMKRDIATFYGLDKDREKEEWIGRLCHDIIDELNMKKLWRFNLITAADITTVSGTSSYTLPTDLWSLYSVRKTDDIDYNLTTMRQHTQEILFESQNSISGYPYVNVVFNIYRDGTIKLFPTPDGVYTISVRYFKLVGKPAVDSDTFDMPPPYQVVIKYGALARLGQMVGETRSATMWERKYQEVFFDMNHRDEDIGDEDLRFVNIEELAVRDSYVNPALRPRFLDFY